MLTIWHIYWDAFLLIKIEAKVLHFQYLFVDPLLYYNVRGIQCFI